MADPTRKQKLTAELDDARAQLGDYTTALKHDLNVGARLKSSMARHPAAWFGAAILGGLLLSRIPASRRKVVVKPSRSRQDQARKAGKGAIALTVLKFGLDFAKPALVRWFGRKMQDHRTRRPHVA